MTPSGHWPGGNIAPRRSVAVLENAILPRRLKRGRRHETSPPDMHLAAGAGALPFSPHIARAQAYPTRPIHWIVSFAAGGPNDTVARIVGQFLSDKLGQQVIVENRVGAGGNIGMGAVLSSPPDGYTLGFVAPNNAINAISGLVWWSTAAKKFARRRCSTGCSLSMYRLTRHPRSGIESAANARAQALSVITGTCVAIVIPAGIHL